jgi:hypothetical protein
LNGLQPKGFILFDQQFTEYQANRLLISLAFSLATITEEEDEGDFVSLCLATRVSSNVFVRWGGFPCVDHLLKI